jgi:hypothetical protein
VLHTLVVDLLQRVLYINALASFLGGLGLVVAPRFLLVTLLGQPEYPDYAFVRLLGVADLALALVLVLIAQRVTELWWWSWAFVVLTGGTAAVTTLHVAFGLPEGASPWMWVVLAAFSWAVAFGLLWGLARAATEAQST